jgi:DNA-binding MarR family transcriptional regulator
MPLAELHGTLPPDEAIGRARRDYDYHLRELAGALGCQYSTVSRRLRAFEERRVS